MLHLSPSESEDLATHIAAHLAALRAASHGGGADADYDEVLTEDGRVRPHWRGMLDWVQSAGTERCLDGALDVARLKNESGLAFAADESMASGAEDCLPVILPANEWATLAAGIEQRAALAEAAIADVYTSRRLVSSGLLPPGLVYGNPDFAAHAAGWERPPVHWLHVYEADVARTADGQWIVLNDRLDAPLGDGWLLANRIAAAQAFSDVFVDLGVRRLANHYAAFQEHLGQMLGWDGRLALLTAGASDPRFFSHAYLARYLGANLVEPADLTVRDGAAYVKTLAGLKRVDVLLRGVRERHVDALHRPDLAAYGAPALSLAARTGSMKLVNAIGSAVFAGRALAPYAHRLAGHLLGEDLLLADAPCLWLGTEGARAQVMADRAAWRVQALATPAGIAPQELDGDGAPADVLRRLGERLCAVQTPPLARAPVLDRDGLRTGEWMMRIFACRTPDGWSVAPSGVASILNQRRLPEALQFGKDVWVLPEAGMAPGARASGQMAQRYQTGHLRRTGRDLLSRVADEVYWLGRNTERAEFVLRTLSICLGRSLDGNRGDSDPGLLSDLLTLHMSKPPKGSDAERYRKCLHALLRDRAEPCALPAMLGLLQGGAVRARSAISGESWRYLDRLSADRRWFNQAPVRQNPSQIRLIEDGVQALAAFAGSVQENLTRNYAWRFMELGRRIERGVQIAGVLDLLAKTRAEADGPLLRAWLQLSDSTSAYRSRYMMTVAAAPVIDLLVLDETNPRSLVFQVAALESVLADLPTDVPYRRPEHRRALALLTELRLGDAERLAQVDKDGTRALLGTLAERAAEDLAEVSNLIVNGFFAHSEAPELLVSQGRQGREGYGMGRGAGQGQGRQQGQGQRQGQGQGRDQGQSQ